MAIGGAVVSSAAAAILSFLIMVEHRRSLQTSALVGLFLLLSVFFDIAKTRSYYLRSMQALAALSATGVVLKFTLLALLEIPKQKDIIDEKGPVGKEALAGFWSRAFFVWLNPTFVYGFRNAIKVEDLPRLGAEFSSELLFSRLEHIWSQGMFVY
jgi:hypothetical protein